MFNQFIKIFGGNPHKNELSAIVERIQSINDLEAQFEKLTDEQLRSKTDEFRAVLVEGLAGISDSKEVQRKEQELLNKLLPQAFAAVREASKRTLGLRHYDVQLIGGIALHETTIAEMRTGEGKTLVGTLPVYLNALTGRGVHLITVNDYLSRRDARWMGPIYHKLGMSIGVLQSAGATENGKKAYLYDPNKESPQEDKHQLQLVDRKSAYEADITYGTNSEFGFDYLRDNMAYRLDNKVQRGHYFAIIDEVDNVLVDEARTPLIISGPASGDLEYYGQMAQVVKQLDPEDFEINEKERSITLTESGTLHVEALLGFPLRDPERPEDVTPEQARYLGYLEQALRAQYLFKRNKDYLVQAGKVVIVDEFTGRVMSGRRWSDGLHQAIEAKEGVKVEPENVTYATITLQNYFRMYQKLAGMTGTALTEAEEFSKIYNLEVLPIPTNLEYTATAKNAELVEVKDKDQDGYEIRYYIKKDESNRSPAYWRRTDYPDMVYRTVEAKLRAITLEIVRDHIIGRPVLVGTTSVESSERLSSRLKAEPIRRLAQVAILRQVVFEKTGKEEDGRMVDELVPLNTPVEQLEPTFLRNFAKPYGVSINPEEPENLQRLMKILRLSPEESQRLKNVVNGGVPHQVLNARRHTEESQIIAGAGSFGAVTIATNMAGRGVDIKLGGELADEITAVIIRLLRRAGFDPYNMRLEEQREAILSLNPSDYGIYTSEVEFFLRYFDEMETVRKVGGLHVIGSERHEARRIDNQLRGRAARQGDPGSSRFYLSLQDDLMRLFGGAQVESLMARFKLDDDFPLENKLVTNLIEQSQHRVEGSNFDLRKHLLEYDDVLNKQRNIIYEQRDRVMSKADLNDDIQEFTEKEVAKRVPAALSDEEGPWKLLSWLEQIQPPFVYGGNTIFPSFTFKVLIDELKQSTGDAEEAIFSLVKRSVELEHNHILKAIEGAIENVSGSLEAQINEKIEVLDNYLDGLKENDGSQKAADVLEELRGLLGIPIKLNSNETRALLSDPASLEDVLSGQVDEALNKIGLLRLIGSIEFRLNERVMVDLDRLSTLEWDDAIRELMVASQTTLETREEKLIAEDSPVRKTLAEALVNVDPSELDTSRMVKILTDIARGRRMVFNTKTHKQETQDFARFSYFYLASQLLEDKDAAELTAEVQDHLEEANQALIKGWGLNDLAQVQLNNYALSDLRLDTSDLNVSAETKVGELDSAAREKLSEKLGKARMAEIHRNALLGIITESWVDYLTRIEALRVSIGLEAYGQRNPLVMYKSKASEMFSALMDDIRSGTIDKVFRYLPRNIASNNNQVSAEQEPTSSTPPPDQEIVDEAPDKKGRKRHKKR